MAPAQAGRSVSAATRVAVPGFSGSTSSSTSRLPSRLSFATVTRRRATRTAGPAELVSYTYRTPSGALADRPGTTGSEKYAMPACQLLTTYIAVESGRRIVRV